MTKAGRIIRRVTSVFKKKELTRVTPPPPPPEIVSTATSGQGMSVDPIKAATTPRTSRSITPTTTPTPKPTRQPISQAQQAQTQQQLTTTRTGVQAEQQLAIQRAAQQPTSRPIGVVTSAEPTRRLERFQAKVQTKRQQLRQEQRREPTVIRGAAQTGLGIAGSILPTAIFVRDIATQPKETIKGIRTGVQAIATQPELRQQVFSDIKQTIKQEPGVAVGFIATEVAFLKGTGAISKAAQISRISKAAKIPTKFVGVQKNIPTGAVTDIVFKTGVGEVGIARAITKTGPKVSSTVVIGKVGKRGVVFPTAKEVFKKQKPFISFERTVVKGGKAQVVESFEGGLQKIKDVKIQKSLGVGGIALAKGKKFIPAKAIKTPFVAAGFSVTRKDLSVSVAKLALPKKQVRGVVGIVKRIKEPSVSTGGISSPGQITKTPLSKTFAPQVQPTTVTTDTISRAIGSIETKTIKSIKTPTPKTITTQTQTTPSITIQQPIQKQLIRTKDIQTLRQPLGLGQVPKTKQRLISGGRAAQITRQLPIQKEVLKSIQVLKQPQVLGVKQKQLLRLRTAQVQPSIRLPSVPIRRLGIPKPPRIRKGKAPKTKQESLIVFERRRKKFRPIGRAGTIGEAISIGKERVAGTLAATFKIQGVKATGVPTPKGFRTKNGLFIERRGKRLSRKTETIEIQQAKRRKIK